MRCVLLIGLLVFLCSAGIVQPADAVVGDATIDRSEFIFRDELVPGMEGYALTVIDGIRIDKINVLLKGIIKDRCFNGRDMLLIETWGDVVDYTYGVAGGMSGSPIYFDGRLAGAISGHWLHTDQRVGIGTPIEYMLENLDYEEGYVDSYEDQLPYGNPFFTEASTDAGAMRIALARDEAEASKLQNELGPDSMVFVKAKMPIIISGVEPHIIDAMRDYIELTFGGEVWDIPVTLPRNVEIPDTLEPGAVLGTMWSRGDIQYGSYGTVTYVSPDGRVLAYGHSMSRRGRTEVPMAFGYIYGRRPGIRKSNKYGGPTRLCGVITQDRGGAISGYFGVEPRMVPVRVTTSINGRDGREYRSEVTGSRFYFPVVCSAVTRACIWRVLPQLRGGVLNVDWRIEFEGGEVISRHDVYNGNDPVTSFGDDLTAATSWAVDNRFERLVPKSVTVKADFNPVDDHIRIISAELIDKDSGLEFNLISCEAVLTADDGTELARVRYIGLERDIEYLKENGKYVFASGDLVFVHVVVKDHRANERHFLLRFLIPEVDPGENGAIQIRGGKNLLPGPELVGPKAYDDALDKRGQMIYFPTFTDSIESYLNELDEKYSADELVVEVIFESVGDAENREDALNFYEAKTETLNSPVKGFIRIPFKIPEEEKEDEES